LASTTVGRNKKRREPFSKTDDGVPAPSFDQWVEVLRKHTNTSESFVFRLKRPSRKAVMMATSFYRWKACDFETISASELQVGDAIAYGSGSPKGNLYGVIPIEPKESLTMTPRLVLVQCALPEGANMSSSKTTEISVFWEGGEPLIRVSLGFDPHASILVRKEGRMGQIDR
jgi:hypothetical protein